MHNIFIWDNSIGDYYVPQNWSNKENDTFLAQISNGCHIYFFFVERNSKPL